MFYSFGFDRVRKPWVFWTALILLSVSGHALAVNQIYSINVVRDTSREIQVLVDYEYSGDHGNPAYMQVIMANNGQELPYYAVRPDAIRPGRGQANITLGLASSAPPSFTSSQLKVNAYTGSGGTFMYRIFPFNKTWGASAPQPYPVPPPSYPERPLPPPMGGQAEVISKLRCGTGNMNGDYIGSVGTINKVGTSGTLSVAYNYNLAHGNTVYLGAYLLDASGQPLSRGFYPATAPQPGQGTASVRVSSDRSGVQSTQAFIWMYEPYKDTAFACRTVPYTMPW